MPVNVADGVRARTAAAFSIVILIYIVIVVVFFSAWHLICHLNSSYILQETNQQCSSFCLFPFHRNDFEYFFRREFPVPGTMIYLPTVWPTVHLYGERTEDMAILKWSNAGRGMIQEGYRMYVFFGEEKLHWDTNIFCMCMSAWLTDTMPLHWSGPLSLWGTIVSQRDINYSLLCELL